MRWLQNLSARAKLFVGFGLMILLLLAVVIAAHQGMGGVRAAQEDVAADLGAVADLSAIEARVHANRATVLAILLTADPAARAALRDDIRERSAQTDLFLRRVHERTGGDPRYAQGLQELAALRAEFQDARNVILEKLEAGKTDEATALVIGQQQARYSRLHGLIDGLQKQAADDVRAAIAGSDDRVNRSRYAFIAVGILSLVVGTVMAMALSRSIAQPLRSLSAAAERVAAGDLSVSLSDDGRSDEVGQLGSTFGRMVGSLRNVAGVAGRIADGDLQGQITPQSDRDVLGSAFAGMAKSLRRVISDITEAAAVVGSAAAEISSSTTQLAASAAETATAVAETTTTVEEVRQTAQVASQKARQVADTAQKTAAVSETGKRAADETTAGIGRIRGQMGSIADSMMRLSEQTQSIGQIIATVDDLAQQSNLLAVNASIEAAKAGDQGKGFAVVAQEIRSLADQSKQATTQVRNILSDIQKATNGAVLATEQGIKAVSAGVTQAAQAGDAILSLTNGVADAAQAATQIAASTQQQLIGVDQVVVAMQSIKQASGQNVDGARQLEQAAKSLLAMGQRLQDLVGMYKV